MIRDRVERVRELFLELVDLPPGERPAVLDARCGRDDAVRAEVESLLAHEASAPEAMHEPIVTFAASTAELSDPERGTPERIGRYEVSHAMASGGMGTVFEAVQDSPRRAVALKLLRFDSASPSAIKRFQHEADILGRLRHPNIAQIYEAGTFDAGDGAQPFFAMELISGRPLLEYCQRASLGTRQRIELFTKVCDAVQYAHQRGVIHRDLKPDNILVDDRGEPKILDFGVARATDADVAVTTLRTDVGQLIGTIPYMSPEQVSGNPEDLDTRSDVYALGVVLYELLSGRLPHELGDRTVPEAVRIISDEDPPRLSVIDRRFSGDVATIVTKALEKDKQRRYQSAGELGADLCRYLDDEPIAARPPSTFYQLRKFARRNRALVTGVLLAFASLAAGTAVATWQAIAARAESRRARTVTEFLGETIASTDFARAGRRLTIGVALDEAADRAARAFASEPETEARIRHLLGISFASMSDLPKSIAQLRLAVAIRRRELGPDDPATLESAHALGGSLRKNWQWQEGREVLADVVSRRRRVLGDRHPDTLHSIQRLADVLIPLGMPDDAEPLVEEAIQGFTSTYGPDSEQALLAYIELAEVYGSRWQLADAERLADENLRAARRVLGDEHWITLTAMRFLGMIHRFLGDREAAERLMRRALDERKRLFGDDDYIALYWQDELGQYMIEWGEIEQGARLLRQAAESLHASYGSRNLRTVYTDLHLGEMEWQQGNLAEAEAILRRCLEIRREVIGDHHPHIPSALADLGWLLCDQGRYDEAEPLLREALTLYATVHDPNRENRPLAKYRLGSCLWRLGRLDEAEALLLEALHDLSAVSPGGEAARSARGTLADLYDASGKPERADQYRPGLPAGAD